MKKFQNSPEIPSSQFQIIPPNSPDSKHGRQLHPMIKLGSHYFKRSNERFNEAFTQRFDNVMTLFACTHCSKKCKCKFVLLKNGNGKMIGDHNTDFLHQIDLNIEQRHLFKQFAANKLESNPNLEPSSIIHDYINRTGFSISAFTPDTQYMTQKINKIKNTNYGKNPSSIEEIDVEELKKFGPSFEFHKIKYHDGKKEYEALMIYNEFQKSLMNYPGAKIMGDGTFDTAPSFTTQLYTFHILIDSFCFPICFVLSVNRIFPMYEKVFYI